MKGIAICVAVAVIACIVFISDVGSASSTAAPMSTAHSSTSKGAVSGSSTSASGSTSKGAVKNSSPSNTTSPGSGSLGLTASVATMLTGCVMALYML